MRVALLWLLLIIPSALWGSFCAYKIKSKNAGFLAGFIPWLSSLLLILYLEFLTSYEVGGGDSMWPIVQLIAGTVAAVFGYLGYKFSLIYLINKN